MRGEFHHAAIELREIEIFRGQGVEQQLLGVLDPGAVAHGDFERAQG